MDDELKDAADDHPQATMLMTTKIERYTDLALKSLKTRLAKDGQPYCYVDGRKNLLAYPLKGKWLKGFLRKAAHKKGDLLRKDELDEIIENMYAHAEVEEDKITVFLRVGVNIQGSVELDIGNEKGDRIVFQNGKAVLKTARSRTLFSRPETMLPLPDLAKKGDWTLILPFLNMSKWDQHLVVAWMTYTISHPRGTAAYPLLAIIGPQGSGKSLLFKAIIRPLVDNNAAGVQLFPGSIRDMAISALSQYLLGYDNIKSVTDKQSGELCVISTGGTYASRKLYTDQEEVMLPVHTPVAITSIHHFVQESDLASRVLTVHALQLDADKRRQESDIAQNLSQQLPAIFKGLVDLCAQALQAEATSTVLYPERMMDFCMWLAALEPAMGLQAGELQKAYSDNLRNAALESVRENALAVTVLNFVTSLPGHHWSGTATELFAELNKRAPPQTINRQSEWPQNPIALGKRLTGIAPILKPQGIEIGLSHGTQRRIEITYIPQKGGHALVGLDEPDEVNDGDLAQLTLAACEPSAESITESTEE